MSKLQGAAKAAPAFLYPPLRTYFSPVKNPSCELMQHANFIKVIRRGVLAVSQLPSRIPGTNIYKPPTW